MQNDVGTSSEATRRCSSLKNSQFMSTYGMYMLFIQNFVENWRTLRSKCCTYKENIPFRVTTYTNDGCHAAL